jgi:DNA-binding MarR family transcriptional regulator
MSKVIKTESRPEFWHQAQAIRTAAATGYPTLSIELIDAALALERTAKVISKSFERVFSEPGISKAGFDILMYLSVERTVRPSELAKRWCVSKGAITGVVQGLEKAGFVQRAILAEDRRAQVLSLTKNGEQFLCTARGKYANWLLEIFGQLSGDDLEHLMMFTQKIIDLLSAHNNSSHPLAHSSVSDGSDAPLENDASR